MDGRGVIDQVQKLLESRVGRVIVGLTGPPGTGKSTFARTLLDAFATTAAGVPMDGFHLSNAQLERLGRRTRKGAPDTFDTEGYVTTMRRVAASHHARDVYVPDFDRRLDDPVAAALVVPAEARLVVTEGNYLGMRTGGWTGVRGLLDRLYYLDCPGDVRRGRLLDRHVAGGRSWDEAVAWVSDVDESNARLVATTESRCDETVLVGVDPI